MCPPRPSIRIFGSISQRAYFQLHELCRKLGATPLARTTVALSDDSLVNFLFHIDGLGSFQSESKRAVRIRWQGMVVQVVPLKSIIKSKELVRRPKDVAHLPLLRQTLKLRRRLGAS